MYTCYNESTLSLKKYFCLSDVSREHKSERYILFGEKQKIFNTHNFERKKTLKKLGILGSTRIKKKWALKELKFPISTGF